jgi:DNA-binding CsgD family transcriptional regulator
MLDWYLNMRRTLTARDFKLTDRENKVLSLSRQGLSAKEIAKELDVSEATIYSDYGKLKIKINVPTIAKAVQTAYAIGILD